MTFIDTHIHLDSSRFSNAKRKDIIDICTNQEIMLINPAISLETNLRMRQLFDEVPFLYYAAGMHPNAISPEATIESIEHFITQKKTIAMGETGLDYYRVKGQDERELQKLWFRRQLELAEKWGLPTILHVREAEREALEILDQYENQRGGVLHCFHGDYSLAEEYLKRNLYLGVGGKVTHESEIDLREAVKRISLEKIVLETDAPYIKTKGCMGIPSPLNISSIAEEIASLKNVSSEEVVKVTAENAKKLFFQSFQ